MNLGRSNVTALSAIHAELFIILVTSVRSTLMLSAYGHSMITKGVVDLIRMQRG